MSELIMRPGGSLVSLQLSAEDTGAERRASIEYPSWPLTRRQICDLELLMNGAFSPLAGFLNRKDYDSVLESLHLADGTLWPMPITLDVTEEAAAGLETGSSLALRDPEGVMLGVLEVGDIWRPDLLNEAERVYGTQDSA